MSTLAAFVRLQAAHRRWAAAVEYALIAALIAMSAVLAMTSVARELQGRMYHTAGHPLAAPVLKPDPP